MSGIYLKLPQLRWILVLRGLVLIVIEKRTQDPRPDWDGAWGRAKSAGVLASGDGHYRGLLLTEPRALFRKRTIVRKGPCLASKKNCLKTGMVTDGAGTSAGLLPSS